MRRVQEWVAADIKNQKYYPRMSRAAVAHLGAGMVRLALMEKKLVRIDERLLETIL